MTFEQLLKQLALLEPEHCRVYQFAPAYASRTHIRVCLLDKEVDFRLDDIDQEIAWEITRALFIMVEESDILRRYSLGFAEGKYWAAVGDGPRKEAETPWEAMLSAYLYAIHPEHMQEVEKDELH